MSGKGEVNGHLGQHLDRPQLKGLRWWGFRALALAFGMLLTFALIEIMLRVYNPIPVSLRGTEIVLPRGKVVVYENLNNPKVDRDVVHRYNLLGFRGPNPPEDFDSVTSIVTVGGSTTHSLNQTDGNTWPDHVQRLLSVGHKNVWVNNAGMDGHSTQGHLILLPVLQELKPDIIVYLIGINELWREPVEEYERKLTPRGLVNRIAPYSEVISTALVLYRSHRALDLGLNHDMAMDIGELDEVRPEAENRQELLRQHRDERLPAFRTRLTSLVEGTRRAGSIPVLMTQPSLHGAYVDPTTGVEIGRQRVFGDVSAELVGVVLEIFNEATRELGREHDVTVIDLARELPRDSALYYDWCHYSNAGAKDVAAIVARGLEPVVAAVESARRSEAVN